MKKTMQQVTRATLSLSIIFGLCLSAGSAQAAQWQRFADTETGLLLIKSGQSGEALQLSSQQMVNTMGQGLPFLQAPMALLQKTVAPLVVPYETGIGRALKDYALENDPKYEQLESRVSLATQTNETLRKAYFINSAIETQASLLPALESQLESRTLAIEEKAAAALVSLSLGYFLSQSAQYAQQIPTDSSRLTQQVTAEITRLQRKISANPLSAFQLGQELQFLIEAQGALAKATEMTHKNAQILPAQSQQLLSLMQKVQKLF